MNEYTREQFVERIKSFGDSSPEKTFNELVSDGVIKKVSRSGKSRYRMNDGSDLILSTLPMLKGEELKALGEDVCEGTFVRLMTDHVKKRLALLKGDGPRGVKLAVAGVVLAEMDFFQNQVNQMSKKEAVEFVAHPMGFMFALTKIGPMIVASLGEDEAVRNAIEVLENIAKFEDGKLN